MWSKFDYFKYLSQLSFPSVYSFYLCLKFEKYFLKLLKCIENDWLENENTARRGRVPAGEGVLLGA